MRVILSSFVVASFVVCTVVACSSEDDAPPRSAPASSSDGGGALADGAAGGEGGPAPSSSFAPGTVLSTLSPADAERYCREVAARFEASGVDVVRASCNFGAVFAALGAKTDDEARAACQTASDTCVAESEAGKAVDCSRLVERMRTCSATVADYDACTTESLVLLDALDAPRFCDGVTAPRPREAGAPEEDAGPKPKSACEALEETCPTPPRDAG